MITEFYEVLKLCFFYIVLGHKIIEINLNYYGLVSLYSRIFLKFHKPALFLILINMN